MILTDSQRTALNKSAVRAREVSEAAAAEALAEIGVGDNDRPSHLSEEQNALRLELRAKARQLGDSTEPRRAELPLLVRDVAYEQWHRLLFARFLEQNGLLRHPDYRDTALSLEDCADLAREEGEPDGWSIAARYASEILPGIFRLTDPSVRVTFPRERMLELETILSAIPVDAFRTEDALGWVYQFWQTAEKKSVNESGRKIGGADLSPVTQLFTENYMVRFLLENSLGAWWAARHPDSPLVAEWDYLRTLEDGTPAAGMFAEWPTTAAEVTVMDPCCGSGHFLVAAFGMLWRMRAEEEGLTDTDAQDAVLRDNLFGLELDPRCTQLARFNVVLEAWKQGGFRRLPVPQIACSGIPVRGTQSEWEAQARNEIERSNLVRLYSLFRNADTLGSLIDPLQVSDDALLPSGLLMKDGNSPGSTLPTLLGAEPASGDVLGQSVIDVEFAAHLLERHYTLLLTNPPYLQRSAMNTTLQDHVEAHFPLAKADLATVFIQRLLAFAARGGTVAVVSPQNWLLLKNYRAFRADLLSHVRFDAVARLGSGAFREITGEVVKVALTVLSSARPPAEHRLAGVGANRVRTVTGKDDALQSAALLRPTQQSQRANPDQRITLTEIAPGTLLSERSQGLAGICSGDYPRFGRKFWERPFPHPDWELQQSTVRNTTSHGGREHIFWWENGVGRFHQFVAERLGEWGVGAWIRGDNLQGKRGIAVSQMSDLPVTLYTGELFDNNTAVILPKDQADLPAIWAYCSSPEFNEDVREIDDALKVTNATLVKVAFDKARWQAVADSAEPLPEPHSDDPTQWLFKGDIPNATHPLQVAVARLLGYRWPDQEPDDLDELADADGIAALIPLPNEPDATTRLRTLLARAYGDAWSAGLERALVAAEGGKTGRLEEWLRDTFFAQHVKVFDNRPFLWHLWDGHKDGGFSAIVNYHQLDHATLNKLTHTVLGAWIERQAEATEAGVAGADLRLAAAKHLRERLQLILDGEAPLDIYVRWKDLHEQAIGWDPSLDDGVRLNIRPFVRAGAFRVNLAGKVKWTVPRYKEADLNFTLAEKRAARAAHEATT